MGIGLGTMAGVGGAVGGMVGGAVTGAVNAAENKPDGLADFKAKVEKLAVMKESGMISDEEFNNLKVQLLSSIM